MRRLRAQIACGLTGLLVLAASGPRAGAQPVDPDNCGLCAGSDFLDMCLMRTWAATSNGPADWLRARGIPFTITNQSPFVITFHSDGEFVIEPYRYEFEVSASGRTGRGSGEMTGGRGCWSTQSIPSSTGGPPIERLNLCHVGDGPKISVVVVMPTGQNVANNTNMFQKPTTWWTYGCNDILGLRLDIDDGSGTGPIPVRMDPR